MLFLAFAIIAAAIAPVLIVIIPPVEKYQQLIYLVITLAIVIWYSIVIAFAVRYLRDQHEGYEEII